MCRHSMCTFPRPGPPAQAPLAAKAKKGISQGRHNNTTTSLSPTRTHTLQIPNYFACTYSILHPSHLNIQYPIPKSQKRKKTQSGIITQEKTQPLNIRDTKKKGLYAQKVNWRIFKKRRRECPRGDAKKKMPNRKKKKNT
jgi:hypothetical protein